MKRARTNQTVKKITPTELRRIEFRRSVNSLGYSEALYRLQQTENVIADHAARIALAQAELKVLREHLATAELQRGVLTVLVDERR